MEATEGASEKSPEPGEKRPKRKMKTAYQLELLEKTYAVSTYPSESLRAELSTKLGLSDRQLQMWFCHRRLKDRKAGEMAVTSSGLTPPKEPKKAAARVTSPALARIEADVHCVKRYYEPVHPSLPPAQPLVEMQAISFVETQLGERIREDGPILGIDFDPLPPGAFGAPIAAGQHSQMGRLYDRREPKSSKTAPLLPNMEHCFLPASSGPSGGKRKAAAAGSLIVHSQATGHRALQEYQFLPEQPTVRSESYEKIASSHFYDSPVDRVSPLSTPAPYIHGNDHITQSYALQGQTSSSAYVAQHGRHHTYASGSERINQEDDVLRPDKKRKGDEARIAKEVEAHEKRIRRELEKQDVLRRKREEQMRKEMERHDRERRKEEERLIRERQREEERFLREQRRENERREKFLQKENRRAEKIRRKEEMRREKEAARIKAAHERAAARRMAREYMELIEDERLELMELAASKKGLSSIIHLDSDALQNMDNLRDTLSPFPPISVRQHFRKPFAIQPWSESEDNVGNLLMVWKFLITFADVLGLWPFTLDEFVQAFHDYDPRLLGEIHISLLKSIIKDIEDVARTPAVSAGANQSSAANPIGGHPHVVEGAYAWGFDIRSWQLHLGPLTWPEILRQFAISAGFGPKLKKRQIGRPFFRDDNEGHDGEDIISTLRNGSAVENAVAMMRDRGFSHLRRSRHRLTPGTVKFAAFHVLSLEGSRGLTILEVADKIQRSGLRDLTTSKTPEASIAAALSRDGKLFERTAPSTYCVKPQFRKNPADAEDILMAAREKIRAFETGLSDSEEAEKDAEEADEVERDEDSESDGAEDLEVDDQDLVAMTENSIKDDQDPLVNGRVDRKVDAISAITAQSDTEIDESNTGEMWVEGLMEGEYSDLSVEERLHALVSLISVALEGNSIRIVLEERLEAATALKKQMWAEAQLDKRRMKEEHMTKLHYSSFVGGANDGSDNELLDRNPVAQEASTANHNSGNDGTPIQQQHAVAAEKSRSQLKSYIGHRAEEMYVYRSLPLGQDRRRNRYWQFVASASRDDPGAGRIFFESKDGLWRLIDSEEAFDALVASLDTRGIRESYLHSVLAKMEVPFKEALKQTRRVSGDVASLSEECSGSPRSVVSCPGSDLADASTSFRIELGRSGAEKTGALARYNDLQRWLWRACLGSSALRIIKYEKKRGKEVDHGSGGESNLLLHHPVRIQLLKALLSLLEVSIPLEALQETWTEESRELWAQKLRSSSTPDDLLQVLTRLERAMLRDHLSSSYETAAELLGSGDKPLSSEPVGAVPWIPLTTAAVGLRLMELDAAVSFVLQQKLDPQRDPEPGDLMSAASTYAFMRSSHEGDATDLPGIVNYHQPLLEGIGWPEMRSSSSGRGRGRGSRGRGGGRGRAGGRRSLGISRPSLFADELNANGEKMLVPPVARRGRGRGRSRGRGKRGRRGRARAQPAEYPRGASARVTSAPPESPSSSDEEDWITPAAVVAGIDEDDDEHSSEYEDYQPGFADEAAQQDLEDSEDDDDISDDDEDDGMGSRDDEAEEDDPIRDEDLDEDDAVSYSSEYSDD
ncbi:homeobox-DDT domain protein RLT2-like isoform X2 [Wolffia australiana]